MAIKTHKVTLSLDNPRVIQSGINVQSFDKQSIQISIELTKNDEVFQVPSDATIRVSLLKLARQEQKIIVDVPNTNRDSIDWIVPDYLDGYQGTVRVGVYLVSGAENVDLGYFTILSNVSDIDKMADEFTDNVFQGWEQIEADLNELNLTIAQTKLDLADDLTQIDTTIANINAKNTQVNTLASDFTTDVATKQADVTSKYNAFDTSVTQANQTIDDILALQPQFQSVLDETTGKDVISAPEIILARGGATTLGERLDSEKADVTAQLAEMVLQTPINIKFPPRGLQPAMGDGSTDDTHAINAIIAFASDNGIRNVYIPDGVYMVEATGTSNVFPSGTDNGGIIIENPINLTLSDNAVLQAKPGSKVGYSILNIKNVSGVKITGGKISGERSVHNGTTGEFGFGVNIRGAQNVTLENIIINDCWGDGIFLGYMNPFTTSNKHIYLKKVKTNNNRRQGLSIVNGSFIYIDNSEFNTTNGTAPQSGIDIEPDGVSPIVTDVFITNCSFTSNTTSDIVLGGGNGCERVTITNCITKNSGVYSIIIVGTVGHTTKDVSLTNNLIQSKGNVNGISLVGQTDGIVIQNNVIKGVPNSTLGSGVVMDGGLNAVISNNTISDFFYGVLFYAQTTGVKVMNNTLKKLSRGIHCNANTLDAEITSNTIRNIATIGITSKLINSQIKNNLFVDVTGQAIYSSLIDSIVEENTFVRIGSSMISLDSPLSSGNTFTSNVFKGVGTQKAIEMNTKPIVPHILSYNVANYHTTPFTVDVDDILFNNLTPQNRLEKMFVWEFPPLATATSAISPQYSLVGASVGDYVLVSPPSDLQGLSYSGYVPTNNFVRITVANHTGVSVTIPSGTWKVKLIKS